MDREQAYEESRKGRQGARSLRCIWYCGRINDEIRRAAKLGETTLELRFPPKHYVVLHRDVFRELYLNQGYDVGIEPNFKRIQPSEWIFTFSWKKEDEAPVQS